MCGAKNGAGKTTLFESIMLCLYGNNSDDFIRESDYHDKILRLFHRNNIKNTVCDESSISMEFEIYFDNEIKQYRITRTWQNLDGKINEQLLIQKYNLNSKLFITLDQSLPNKNSIKEKTRFDDIDSIDESGWQQFINRLIPRGIAKLFFFDGEKIQSIADNKNENKYIQSSFDTLLGLDVVYQLQKDIEYFIAHDSETKQNTIIKKRPKGMDNSLQHLLKTMPTELDAYLKFYTRDQPVDEIILSDYDHLENTLKNLKKDISKKEQKYIQLEQLIISAQEDLLSVKEKYQKIGGIYPEKFRAAKDMQETLKSKIDFIGKEIRTLCSAELPFSLIPDQMLEIRNQIESDQMYVDSIAQQKIIEKNLKTIKSVLNSTTFLPKIPNDIKKSIGDELVQNLKKEFKKTFLQKSTIFDFSQLEMMKIILMIDGAQKPTIDKIKDLCIYYEKYEKDYQKIEHSKKNRANIHEIEDIWKSMEAITLKKVQFETDLKNLEEKTSQRNSQLNLLNSRIRICLNLEKDVEQSSTSQKLAHSILGVLDEYSLSLRAEKISILEDNVLKGLEMLMHKKDFIKKVIIDKDTFDVILYNFNDDEITKNMLSKGELQIYATALVWGLAKTSGRTLPFMIDTPLARLDVEHRDKLVESFFPKTSQQTIILSTDSEIDNEYFKKLQPFISKSYVMEFDDSKGQTQIREGYFNENEGDMTIEVF